MLACNTDINNKKMNKITIKSVIIILLAIIIISMMIVFSGINNNSNRRLLNTSSLTINATIDINIINKLNTPSLLCYNNDSSANYGGSTANVTCSQTGYTLTSCLSIMYGYKSVRSGVISDGKYCYAKHISNGKENQYEVSIQARCCKSNSVFNILNTDFVLKEDVIKNQCNDAYCNNIVNKTVYPIGNSISFNGGLNDIDITQYQGLFYLSNGIKSYGGNNNMKMGLFCGYSSSSKHYLQCNNVFGSYISGEGYSSAKCSTNYTLTSCESLHRPFTCSTPYTDTTNYLSGSYISNEICYSYGTSHMAIANCCQLV